MGKIPVFRSGGEEELVMAPGSKIRRNADVMLRERSWTRKSILCDVTAFR